MLSFKQKRVVPMAYPLLEKLEQREFFSVAVPAGLQFTTSPALTTTPATLVAATTKKAPKVTAIQSVNGTGLTGEYFSDANFQNGKVLRTDPTVKLAPSQKKKDPAVLSSSIQWTGQIAPTYTEAYSFSVITNGGVRLWVNGQLMIDQAQSLGGNLRSPTKISLVAGQKYSIQLQYTRKSAAGASVQLLWSSAHQKQGLVPQKAMYPDLTVSLPAVSGGLIGQYYLGKNFNQLVMQRVDPAIDFSFGTTSPTYLIPNGSSFSIRWTGQIVAKYSETYTFKTLSDDGVRLWVDDTLLIDDFTDHLAKIDSAQITLVAGQAYDIRMDYYQDYGAATAHLSWSSPSQPQQIVPASALTSTPAATAGTLTTTVTNSNSIHLSWTGSASATGYDIEESTDGGLTFQIFATTAAEITSYDVTGLNAATKYWFRIAPLGSKFTSIASNTLPATTTTDSPSNVVATAISATAANISWGDVTGENGFAILESTDGGATFSQVGIIDAGVTTLSLNNLVGGFSYQFEIEAINSAGTPSAASVPTSIVTLPDAPAGLTTTATSTTTANIAWGDVAGESGFVLERSPDGVTGWSTLVTLPTGTLSYTDSTLTPGTSYFYRVSALNSGGSSVPSAVSSVLSIPSMPIASLTGLSVSQSQVSWAAVSGASQYIVQRSTDGATNWTTAATVGGSSLSATVANLTSSTMFYYRVAAVNASGSSAQSSTVSQVTAPLAQYAAHSMVYGTTATGAIYDTDLVNGTSTWIGQLPVTPQGAVRDPLSGVLYFYKQGTSNIYEWDPATGNTIFIDTSFIPVPTVSGAYEPTGTSFIVGNNGTLFQGASGTLSVTTIGTLKIAGVAFAGTPTSMSFSPTGTLYMTAGSSLYTVNITTAAMTPVATGLLGNTIAVFGPKGLMYMTSPTGSLYSFNLTSLVSSLLSSATLPSFTSLAADAVFTHLAITASATPTTFTQGQSATYSIQVTNTSGDVSSQPITVTTTLPTGLSYVSTAGTGWVTSVNGQIVTFTYAGGVAANGSLPALSLTVAVGTSAPAAVTTQFMVSSGDLDANALTAPATVVSVVV